MKKAIRKLRLRDGDILVVSDPRLLQTLNQMSVAGTNLSVNIPIVYAPEGIKRVNKKYIRTHLLDKSSVADDDSKMTDSQ